MKDPCEIFLLPCSHTVACRSPHTSAPSNFAGFWTTAPKWSRPWTRTGACLGQWTLGCSGWVLCWYSGTLTDRLVWRFCICRLPFPVVCVPVGTVCCTTVGIYLFPEPDRRCWWRQTSDRCNQCQQNHADEHSWSQMGWSPVQVSCETQRWGDADIQSSTQKGFNLQSKPDNLCNLVHLMITYYTISYGQGYISDSYKLLLKLTIEHMSKNHNHFNLVAWWINCPIKWLDWLLWRV